VYTGIAVIMAIMGGSITMVVTIMVIVPIVHGILAGRILLAGSCSIASGIGISTATASTSYTKGGDQEKGQQGKEEIGGKDLFSHVERLGLVKGVL
jgi:type IV secretory pathway TrbL component